MKTPILKAVSILCVIIFIITLFFPWISIDNIDQKNISHIEKKIDSKQVVELIDTYSEGKISPVSLVKFSSSIRKALDVMYESNSDSSIIPDKYLKDAYAISYLLSATIFLIIILSVITIVSVLFGKKWSCFFPIIGAFILVFLFVIIVAGLNLLSKELGFDDFFSSASLTFIPFISMIVSLSTLISIICN